MEERIFSTLKAKEQIKQETIPKKAAASRVNPVRADEDPGPAKQLFCALQSFVPSSCRFLARPAILS
jgi:hypothetical protein